MICTTRPSHWLLPLMALAASGCGGMAVVDSNDGSGGSTSGSGASGSGASGSGASGTGASGTGASGTGASGSGGSSFGGSGVGGGECAELEAEMLAAHDAATACDPLVNAVQCSGTTIAKWYCNCPVVANDAYPNEAAKSFELGTLWYQTCEYNFCEGGCYPTDAPWYCDPATNRCQPTYE